MRTDATFDRRQVICKHATWLGYGKVRAQVGDLILTKDGTLGRMLARITHAPQLEHNDKPIKNWILVLAMTGQMLEHTSERWIDPEDVTRVESVRDQSEVIAYFLSDQTIKAPINEMRRCASEGWSTLDAYRKWFKESRQIAQTDRP
jgi:hypothetical protein